MWYSNLWQKCCYCQCKELLYSFVGMFKLDLNNNNIENRVKLLVFVRGRIVSRATAGVGISLLHEKERLNRNTFIKEDHSELTCECLDYSGQPLGLGETWWSSRWYVSRHNCSLSLSNNSVDLSLNQAPSFTYSRAAVSADALPHFLWLTKLTQSNCNLLHSCLPSHFQSQFEAHSED